jgi:hypothetical protein
MNENICGVSVTIAGVTYTYEAHSFNKVVEILASHVGENFPPVDSFAVNYFKVAN